MRFSQQVTARRLAISLLTGTSMAAVAPAAAQETTGTTDSNTIVVTALKREQNLQDVPLAITALGGEKLEELHVNDLQDAVKFLPSVTIQSGGPGFSQLYFRGISSGENANHSTSLPTVATYLDEMSVTTIQGALDIHAYDLNRIEALAGPQGTLYGASSMAGTLRLITNQPDQSGSYGAIDLELNATAHGDMGGVIEGFYNIPLSDKIAMRIVGWYDHDAGYIDNIPGSRTFAVSGITQDNAALVEDDYNDVDTFGGRLALGIDLNESWTLRPTVMYQRTETSGFFAQERSSAVTDELQVVQYNPEFSNDEWVQAALTVEGRLGSWDMVATGGYLWRDDEVVQDYSDYSYFYDALYSFGSSNVDNDGNLVSPNQYIQGADKYRRSFGELRFSSPAENRWRVIAGLFAQRQVHYITQHYIIDDIADSIQVPGTDDNIWLTQQKRTDRDYAAFGELSFDITDDVTATGGIRVYSYKNSLIGFFGYNNPGFSSNPIYACQAPAVVDGSPCTNLDKTTSDTDFIHKLNLTWNITDDVMTYVTWSRGFRPGGINRRGSLPPYAPDKLDNYEMGLKSTFGDFRFNAAIYQQDWDGIQLSFIGANGLSEVRNAGIARVRGLEFDVGYNSGGFDLNLAGSYNDAEIREPFCAIANDDFDCTIAPPGFTNAELAPAGTRLPLVPKFKGSAVARYETALTSDWTGHIQAALTYVGGRRSDLRTIENEIKGMLADYTIADFAIGATDGTYRVELYATNLFDSGGRLSTQLQCLELVCGDPTGGTSTGPVFYDTRIKPRIIGIRFGRDF